MNDTLSFHKHLLAKGTHLVRLSQLAEGANCKSYSPATMHPRGSSKGECLLKWNSMRAIFATPPAFAAAMSLRPYDSDACLAYNRAVRPIGRRAEKGYAASSSHENRSVRAAVLVARPECDSGWPAFRAIKAFRRVATQARWPGHIST